MAAHAHDQALRPHLGRHQTRRDRADYDSHLSGAAPMLTAEDTVKRNAAECAFVDDRCTVGIRLKAAIEMVREYGDRLWRRPSKSGPAFGDGLSAR